MSILDTLAGTGTTDTTHEDANPSSTPHVRVVPYNALFDPQADAFLSWLWQRMRRDDLVDYYFPGQRDTGFATFVRLMSGDANVALIVTDAMTKQWNDTIAGFITWTPSRMGASDIIIAGFIFFHEHWGRATDDAARASFEHWFTATEAQVVLGVCPSLHKLAIRYNLRIGLHEVGRIPLAHIYKGEPCDAILFAMTRDGWRAKCQQPQ